MGILNEIATPKFETAAHTCPEFPDFSAFETMPAFDSMMDDESGLPMSPLDKATEEANELAATAEFIHYQMAKDEFVVKYPKLTDADFERIWHHLRQSQIELLKALWIVDNSTPLH